MLDILYQHSRLSVKEFAEISGIPVSVLYDYITPPSRKAKGIPPRRKMPYLNFCNICAKFGLRPVITFEPLLDLNTNEVE